MTNFKLLFMKYLFILISIFFMSGTIIGSQTSKILVVSSYESGFEWTDRQNEGIQNTFDSSDLSLQVKNVFLDIKTVYDKNNYLSLHKKLLEIKSLNFKPDIIICNDAEALKFISEIKEELFAESQLVFSGFSDDVNLMSGGINRFSGNFIRDGLKKNLELAIKLFPNAKNLAFVHDQTDEGKMYAAATDNAIVKFSDRNFFFLTNLNISRLKDAIEKLPSNTIVFLLNFNYDANNDYYDDDKACEIIAKHSKKPVFGLKSTFLGHGIIGGYLINPFNLGKLSAQTALEIIKGREVNPLNTIPDSAFKLTFDEDYLKKADIERSSLPAGSMIINSSYSKNNLNLYITGSLLILLTAALLGAYFILRRKNK